MSDAPDHRGSEEINRLADHVMANLKKHLSEEAADTMTGFIRDVYIVPALVNAYAKGVEIGDEYARKDPGSTSAVPK